VDVEELIRHYPRLFHMTAAGSWPSIATHGLLPARDIVASSSLSDAERASVLTQPRRRPVLVDHPELGAVTLRDQSPLHLHILEAVLIEMTVPQWLAVLNDRIYFWLRPSRLTTLLQSRPNRGAEHDVLTVDTASLVAAHHDQIRLSAVNSGATQWPSAPPRGAKTFSTIEDYPFTERRRGRTLDYAIAELAVIGGVPDVAAHVVGVQRRRGLDVIAELPLTAAQGRPAAGEPLPPA
jgi:hypothetical protein